MAQNTPPPMPQGASHPTPEQYQQHQQQHMPQQQQFQQHPGQQAPYPPVQQVQPHGQLGGGNAGFGRVLLSEWTKIRTVRSTMWTLIVMVGLIVGMAVLLGGVAKPGGADDYVALSLIGVMIAQIAAATLGVLTISAEYTTGMIRTTLTAYPRRIQVLVAKGLVFAGLMFVVGVVTNGISALIGQSMLTSRFGDSTVDTDLFRSIVGSSLYLAVIGLFGLGLGALLRHSAGAITALLGVILLPMIIGPMLPSGGDKVMEYSPMFALIKLIGGSDGEDGLGAWPSLLLIAVYAAIALIAGGVRLTSRDV
ncbi:ABC transporter permease subunit [Streptomyces sp. SID3343]|uniref:ABC transporter permease subunit n=1 Tax=Streptomyces sp. SID3343 TaxID=2690260 RepID=UPI00136CFBFD|nr:ABC transporter permease subunit [Streptomyces sp. SID3343]MYW01650.1 ABC transporter permease subunit [Streptomyces sp. SID3343]